MQLLSQKLNLLLQEIREAEKRYAREENSVSLLAVSKTRNAEAIASLAQQGQLNFGENYQQEARDKLPLLTHLPLIWHFIGPLQSNKSRFVAENFSWVHSVDRVKIAERLNHHRPENLPPLNICLQVNISGEASKSGVRKEELGQLAGEICNLPKLKLRGIMSLPSPTDDFTRQRNACADVRHVFESLLGEGFSLDTLSMGTTNDMRAAIAEGATIVRLGTALFGKRD